MTDNAKIESLEKINIYRFFPWICLALAIALIIAAIVNAPPKSVSIEAGPKGGFFDTTAHLLKAKLKEKGITVTVINSEETLQIIKHVDDPKSGVDIGFIAHEVPVGKYQNIKSLGSITMDPLFIYLRQNLKIDSPADFAGLRLGVGPLDTGGRVVTDAVLDLYGIHPGNATYVPLSLLEMADAIEKGTVDVAFFLQPTNNKVVARIGESGVATLMSLGRAEAIIKKYGYLHHLTIEPGAFSLGKDLPATPIQMIGIPATVIAKDNIHPAVVTEIALTLKEAFRAPTLVTSRGAFPTMDLERDLDSDTDAERIYKSGTGFVPTLYKIFNFWIAGVLDKIALLLSFVLSAYVFFSFMGFPSPYNIWKGGTADRHLAALENLHKKAQKKSLSTNELKKIRKIEAYFNESDGTSKKATQLIWDITKKNKGPTSPHHT